VIEALWIGCEVLVTMIPQSPINVSMDWPGGTSGSSFDSAFDQNAQWVGC
jgi:hypothetical protein